MTGTPNRHFYKFDKDLLYFMRKHDLPGASVAVIHGGKVIYQRGFGWANLDTQEKVTPKSLFRIASISKTITAAGVVKLAQEHKLSLEDHVFKILNDLHTRPRMRENPLIKHITVINLLRMLSGWDGDEYIGFDPVFGPWPSYYRRKLDAIPPVSCKMAAEFMMGMPLQSVPGTHFSYANINYCLLGLIINKSIHQPYGYQAYQQFIQMSILRPMGITDMLIGSTSYAHDNEVHYYASKYNNQFPYGNEDILHKAYAVGGWLATATDLAKFAYYLPKMMTSRSLRYVEEMPPGVHYKLVGGFYPTHYAMGWFVSRHLHGYEWYTHGSFTGTRSVIVKRPDGYIVAVVFNKRPWPVVKSLHQIIYMLEHERF